MSTGTRAHVDDDIDLQPVIDEWIQKSLLNGLEPGEAFATGVYVGADAACKVLDQVISDHVLIEAKAYRDSLNERICKDWGAVSEYRLGRQHGINEANWLLCLGLLGRNVANED